MHCLRLSAVFCSHCSGCDAMETFLRELEELEDELRDELANPVDMDELTPDEQEAYETAPECWICERAFDPDSSDIRVRDHDHITGKFRGAAHQA